MLRVAPSRTSWPVTLGSAAPTSSLRIADRVSSRAMERSLATRNIIASAKMEGVDLSEQTISDLHAVEAGTKTAEQAIAEYLEERIALARP